MQIWNHAKRFENGPKCSENGLNMPRKRLENVPKTVRKELCTRRAKYSETSQNKKTQRDRWCGNENSQNQIEPIGGKQSCRFKFRSVFNLPALFLDVLQVFTSKADSLRPFDRIWLYLWATFWRLNCCTHTLGRRYNNHQDGPGLEPAALELVRGV